MNVAELIRGADQAMAVRDFGGAASLLEQAAALQPEDLSLWMRVAAMRRASSQPARALEAVHKALALKPRDFTALLMRASLLQKLDQPDAGEAWGHALAQKPEGELPEALRKVIADAEQHYAAWQEQQEARLKASMAAAEDGADDEQRKRMARFRSNSVRRTRPYHSEPTHYHYPELTEREFHPRRLFPWLEKVEAATEVLIQELRTVMAAERAELVPYVQYDEHVPMDQWRPLNNNPDWTAIHSVAEGRADRGERTPLPADHGAPGRARSAGDPRRFAQCHVLAACAEDADPAACRDQQCPPRVPSAADRPGRLLVQGRRANASMEARRSLRVRRHDRA